MPRRFFGLFTTDTALVVRTWDGFLAEITGLAPEQALDRPLGALLPELDQRGFLAVLKHVADSGTVEVLAPAIHRYLIACAPADPAARSEHMQQRVTIGPVREDGRIVGVAVTIEDVTARVERERGIADLTRALGGDEWRTRHDAVRRLAVEGAAIVDTLVQTLREQHHNFNVLSSLLDLLTMADIDVVEPLVACLLDEDVDLRIQAALILGRRRDRRAVPALVTSLDDPDLNVRFHAVEALGLLRVTEAVGRLAEMAAAGDFFLAFPAIQALARIGDPSVAPRLVPLLGDELLRAAVSEALGELGDELVVAPLVVLLNEPDAPIEAVADALAGLWERYEHRYGAGEHVASLVRRAIGPAGTQNLLDAAQRAPVERLRGLARVLGWLNGPAVERALTRLLGTEAVRAQVVEALVRYGAGVVDLLVEQLAAEDLDTRQAAAVALGRIGDRRATGPLVAALKDPELALPVARALARLGDDGAFEALLGLLGDADAAVRTAAVAALNSIGHPAMPSRIAPLLDDSSPVARESAVRIAGYFGYPGCADRVLQLSADPSEAVRRAAVEHLPFFDHAGVVPTLVHALQTGSPAVRAAAAAALARLDERVALAPLVGALDDDDPWVRYFALRSIGRFASPAAAPAVLRLLERDPAGHVRLAAIDVLGRIETSGAIGVLEPLTGAAEPDLARAAIRALGHARDARVFDLLQRLLRADDEWRRLAAVAALGARGGVEAASALQWVVAADGARSVAAAAIGELARLAASDGGDALAAIGAAVGLLAEPAQREQVIEALSSLPERRTGDVAQGLRHAQPAVRRATIEALSRMKNPGASREIERALEDPEAAVRATAAAELRRLGSRHAVGKLLTLARTDPDLEVRQAAVMAVAQHRADAGVGRRPEA